MGGKTNTKSLTNITDAHTRSLVYKHTFVKLHEEKKKKIQKKERERKGLQPWVLFCFIAIWRWKERREVEKEKGENREFSGETTLGVEGSSSWCYFLAFPPLAEFRGGVTGRPEPIPPPPP